LNKGFTGFWVHLSTKLSTKSDCESKNFVLHLGLFTVLGFYIT
jgi:hypothetical protein